MILINRFALRLTVALVLTCAIELTTLAEAPGQQLPAKIPLANLSVVAPALNCAKLATSDISKAVGARTSITSAEVIAEGKPAPYCRVTGYVEPMVKFEVRLPMTTWTQRFVQTGCGGLCGNLNIRLEGDDGCYPAQHGELALASTDMGHSGGMDGKFGQNDYQLRVDFAYRGVHVTTLASKAIITAFYGQAPRFSYFAGCSDGGREALMEAERYPDDFNGITAGAPAMNFTTQNTFYHGWNATKNTDQNGMPILTADKLPILHQAVLRACDAADGVKDGLISDPLSCHFDPSVIECKKGAVATDCLTHAQVETARAIYQGAHSDKGDKLVLSGPLPGSELAWAGVYVPFPGDNHSMSSMISTGSLSYLIYENNPPDSYTLSDLKFTAESFAATTKIHALYDATDPDLNKFSQAGGKLILWHGLADPHISPINTIAYYTAMKEIMGENKVQQFARLYLFPGGYHCGGGEGPFDFDLLSAMMAWVEKGSAPFALIASHQAGGPQGPTGGAPAGMPAGGIPPGGPPQGGAKGMPPIDGGGPTAAMPPMQQSEQHVAGLAKVDRTRPVYPYPFTAKYTGTGSIDEAKNFGVGPAKPASASQLEWLGSSFYRPNYEVWCKGNGAAMVCTSKP